MEALDREIEMQLGGEWTGLRWLAMEATLLVMVVMRSFSELSAIDGKLGKDHTSELELLLSKVQDLETRERLKMSLLDWIKKIRREQQNGAFWMFFTKPGRECGVVLVHHDLKLEPIAICKQGVCIRISEIGIPGKDENGTFSNFL